MAASDPILPIPGQRNILITSALPYVNNVPHLGNIIGSVLSADVFSRFCKARGFNCLFVCGSDEFGTATETKALEEGVDPETLCAKYHKIHKDIYDWFNINFDIFGRTPTPQQTEIVQNLLKENSVCGAFGARGDQCDKCGNLLDPLEPEPEVNEAEDEDIAEKATGFLINPRCKLDGATPLKRRTKHLYLLLDLLRDQIVDWFKIASKKGAWSSNAIQITQPWIDKGLKPRGISRDLKWGVPIPKGLPGLNDEDYANKVFYVWFDACCGYPSITKVYTDKEDLAGKNWEKYWKNPDEVSLFQFMGKDNTQFHSIIFPGSLLGTGEKWTKVHKLSTTEYLNYGGGKFSKSRQIGVFGDRAKDVGIDPDIWRFYLLSRRPETSDSEFKWQEFIDANNNDLLKNLGNFCNRVLKFCAKFDGAVPDYSKYSDDSLKTHVEEVNKLLTQHISELEANKLRAGLSTILHISALGNKLLQDNKLDNRLFSEEPDRCAAVVGLALNQIDLLAGVLYPYMPATAESIFSQLGQDGRTPKTPEVWDEKFLKPGHKIGTPKLLFTQIPASKLEEWREAFGGEEVRKQKEEAAAKAAAKKAAKEKEKEKKRLKKEKGKALANGQGIEHGEKEDEASPEIEKVTNAIAEAEIHTS